MRVLSVSALALAIAAAAPIAVAGPCEVLAGHRWTFYAETPSQAGVVTFRTGVLDLRTSTPGGSHAHYVEGQANHTPGLVMNPLAAPLAFGIGTIQGLSCVNLGNDAAAVLGMEAVLSTDGLSAVIRRSGSNRVWSGWMNREHIPPLAITGTPRG